jgi:branched-chain amino acid transport system permease protein
VWPPEALADRTRYSWLTLAVVALALAALARIAASPFGRALRGARDSALRAEAIGIDVRGIRWAAFALAGAFAGLAGGLFAYSKGSISPETLAIPRSVDALVMVLLGGLNTTFGPVLGAGIFTWGQDALARATDYWRAALGIAMLTIVTVMPNGLGGLLAWRTTRRDTA